MGILKKYYYVSQDRRMQHFLQSLIDIILLFVYVVISFYNAIGNINSMRINGNSGNWQMTIHLLVWINIIILMRNHIKLSWKIETYRKEELLRKEKEKKIVTDICILAWVEKRHIIYYGYLSVVVVLIAIKVTGYEVLYPIGLVSIFVTLTTFLIELIDCLEDILGLIPVPYFGERRL